LENGDGVVPLQVYVTASNKREKRYDRLEKGKGQIITGERRKEGGPRN